MMVMLSWRFSAKYIYADGNPFVARISNPLLDSGVYTVELYDRTLCKYAANLITKNVYSQVDDNRWENILMSDNI